MWSVLAYRARSYAQAALAWLKGNWQWVAVGLGLLVLFFRRSSSNPVVSPASVEAEDARIRIDAEASTKVREADVDASRAEASVEAARSAAVSSATQSQVTAAAEASSSSEGVNELLLRVGKEMR